MPSFQDVQLNVGMIAIEIFIFLRLSAPESLGSTRHYYSVFLLKINKSAMIFKSNLFRKLFIKNKLSQGKRRSISLL